MKAHSLLALILLCAALFGLIGCSSDAGAAKPTVVKGGLDPDRSKAAADFKITPMK
jgi:hypothetical protein